MKLEKAIRLMSEDYLDYKQFLGMNMNNRHVADCYKDRVASLLDYVNFRMDYGCPDVEEYEHEAAKAIRKYAHEQARRAIEELIPVDSTAV